MIPKPEQARRSVGPVEITRRDFVKAGGALFVSLAMLPRSSYPSPPEAQPTPTPIASWIEIRSDNTILVRTGRTEIGTGMSAFYAQVVAEELCVRPEAITLIMGDTDKTPDGGYSAGFVSGGGKSISYGQLVQGQHLDLKIPVTGKSARFAAAGVNSVAGLDWEGMDGLVVAGDPPMKPVSQYKVIGTSFPMPAIRDKVTGKTQWSCDVRLPGMLHARMVRPATVGSTLVSVGEIDRKQFPTAEAVRKANLVAVVSPDEWEAIRAAQAVAAGTKWTEWSGLAGSENLTKTLREHKWGAPDQTRGNAADVATALANAPKSISASYEQPCVKHAPIGPFLAVADVRSDGTVTVWTHSAHSQALRARIANTLGTTAEKVVVRWLE